MEGTLSFEVARASHARAGNILYSPDWTDGANAYGMTDLDYTKVTRVKH